MDVAWASFWEKAGAGFGAAICSAFARSCSVICNSVFADRIVMAASRLLSATAACIIFLSFAADIVNCIGMAARCLREERFFSGFFPFAGDFPLKTLFEKCFKIVFFFLWRRDPVLELQCVTLLRVVVV